MRCTAFQTDFFGSDGRGPTIRRFIHDRDLIAPGTFADRSPPPGRITGVEYMWHDGSGVSWVIFEGIQVVQIVPEEVCSYWFHDLHEERLEGFCGISEIHESAWKAGFYPRHLDGIRHFVLEFLDDIIEVLCKSLVFGSGVFQIENHPELTYYKPWPPEQK